MIVKKKLLWIGAHQTYHERCGIDEERKSCISTTFLEKNNYIADSLARNAASNKNENCSLVPIYIIKIIVLSKLLPIIGLIGLNYVFFHAFECKALYGRVSFKKKKLCCCTAMPVVKLDEAEFVVYTQGAAKTVAEHKEGRAVRCDSGGAAASPICG